MLVIIDGYEVVIDDDISNNLMKYRWHVKSRRHGIYFAAMVKQPDGKEKAIFLHRFIMGEPPGLMVDHIDGDHFNCQRENLRICTNAENSRNRKKPITNKTGFKGVSMCRGKYVAKVKCMNKSYYLGAYNTPQEAADAYNTKAKELFGDFYREDKGA